MSGPDKQNGAHPTHPEEVSMLLDARNSKVVGNGADANDQFVVGNLVLHIGRQSTSAVQHFVLHVQPHCTGQVKVMLISESGVSDGLDDAPEL